jgi:hypothetical protein
MDSLRQIRQFQDPRKLALFLRIAFRIPVFWCLAHQMEMPALLGFLDRSSQEKRPFSEEDLEWARLASKYANFFLLRCLKVKNPCLLRSLILFRLFRRVGFDVQIHFGVKKNDSLLEGHSWLLLNGVFFLEQKDPKLTYTQVYSYPDERIAV